MTKKQLFDSNLKYVIDVTNGIIIPGRFTQLDKGKYMSIMFTSEEKHQWGIMFYREEARDLSNKVDGAIHHYERIKNYPNRISDEAVNGCENVMNTEYPFLIFSSLEKAKIIFKAFIFAEAMERFQLEAEATRDEYLQIVDKIGKIEKLNASL